jgi:hypothetical protein
MGVNRKSTVSVAVIILMVTVSFVSLGSVAPRARALSLYNSGDPTPAEQLVLQYINRARANPTAEGRRLGIDITEGLQDDPSNGCYGPQYVGPRPPLAMNSILHSIAQAHSEDMYNRNYFDHTTPDGVTAFQRMTNAGYEFSNAGENIGAGTEMTATQLEDELMLDPGYPCRAHRMNLLDIFPGYPPPAYLETGIGYYQGSNGQAFITEDFGTASQGPFLIGVVYSDANGNNFYDIGEGIPGVTITPSAGDYYAISSSSGGYQFPIPTSGTLTVTASSGGFGPISKTITLTGSNVELDFTPQGGITTTATQTTTSQTTLQSTTQSFTQTTSQTTVQTTQTTTSSTQSYQSSTQTSSSSSSTTTPALLESVLFQSSPSTFMTAALPGTITACGNTYSYFESGVACGMSFGATANLPTPASGWTFDHWTWAGGVACASTTTNPASCSAFNSGGILIAVYAAQVTVLTNPASPASVNLGSCSASGWGNGQSFFSYNFGSIAVTACNIPAGYAFYSWSCSAGLACPASKNPTNITLTGPGTIQLNLQLLPSNNASTTSASITTASASTMVAYTPVYSTTSSTTLQSSTSTQLTLSPIPGFPWESIIAGILLGAVLLVLTRRRSCADEDSS